MLLLSEFVWLIVFWLGVCSRNRKQFIIFIQICIIIAEMKTEKFPDDPEKDIEARTYTLDCDGAIGDMVYLTDTDYNLNHGHNFVEVKIYGSGK